MLATLTPISGKAHEWAAKQDLRNVVAMASQIRLRKPSGELVELPDVDNMSPTEYKTWTEQQGDCEQVRPIVRIGGVVSLSRNLGRLQLLQLREAGDALSVLVSAKDVSEQDFAAAKWLRLRDSIEVSGRLGRTATGKLTVFAEKVHV